MTSSYSRFRWGLASLMFLSALVGGYAQVPMQMRTSEELLRRSNTRVIRPTFPEDALRNGNSGVAVAEVYLDVAGHVSKVIILEAPVPSIAKSVSDAVAQWEFTPTTFKRQPVLVSGNLTFYFEVKGRRGVVMNPSETGYVGRSHEQFKDGSTQ